MHKRSLPRMAERDSYAAGTPSWIDLGSPDPDASARFYSGLFGWEINAAGPPEAGGYRMAMLKGRAVAGIGQADADGTPWWTTYISVDDAAATAKAVEATGGTVLVEPFDVFSFGRMAAFADPGGATFSIWQPMEHPGAGLVNEPGTLTWNELTTRHLDSAKTFYSTVFGWNVGSMDMGEGNVYTVWQIGEEPIGGSIEMVGEEWPADLADHWMVYFAVENCDESVARATALGATVSVPPTDIPTIGRFSVLNGPHGEVFSVIANPPAADSNT